MKKTISGLWYHELAEEIKSINENVEELLVYVEANWWFTQIDADSRH